MGVGFSTDILDEIAQLSLVITKVTITVHYCTLRSTSVSLFEVICVVFVLPILGHILLELFKLELPACAP